MQSPKALAHPYDHSIPQAPREFGRPVPLLDGRQENRPWKPRRRPASAKQCPATRAALADNRAWRYIYERPGEPSMKGRQRHPEGKRTGQRPDSKSGAPQGVVGSNPMPSAVTMRVIRCQTPCPARGFVFDGADVRSISECQSMPANDGESQPQVHAEVHARCMLLDVDALGS